LAYLKLDWHLKKEIKKQELTIFNFQSIINPQSKFLNNFVTHISYFITLDPSIHEIEIAYLNQMGVESFIEHDQALEAFIEAGINSELEIEIENYLIQKDFPFEKKMHQAKDWNAEWEMNFMPIAIGDRLLVRASFHLHNPDYKQEIIITPKMAFGTGHHETTSMILEWMILQDINGKSVLDFGCGTGILGIFAAKCDAGNLCFIDNDPLAIENTNENISANKLPAMEVRLGSYDVIPDETYDLILANITRNILSEGLKVLSGHLKSKAKIVMSGFLLDDLEFMLNKIHGSNLNFIEKRQKSDWLCIIAEKQ
jgi:ribosomal protein L11 methyltransferase